MRLSASDAAFLYAESHSGPMHISSVYVLEGELAFDRVLQHMAERIDLIPAYKRKVAFVPGSIAHPVWVDDPSFNLANHVREHKLPAGTDLQSGIDYAVELNEPMLDRSRPLWMMHVITGVPERTLILQETHHCMIDGASGIELTTLIYDLDPNPDATNVPPAPQPGADEHTTDDAQQPSAGGTRGLFFDALSENVKNLLADTRNTQWLDPAVQRKQSELMRKALAIGSRFLRKPAITAPFNASVVGPKRRARFMKKPFAEIREIRRALGGTINDVVLTVITEALARYLEARNEPVTDEYLRLMCPVNVRTEDQQGALGNQVSGIFPMLPAWSMPVTHRLGLVIAEMERIKREQEAQALTLVSDRASSVWPIAMAPTQLVGTPFDPTRLFAQIPWPIMPNIGWRPPNPGINFICTNVPGVQVPQYLVGHKVLDTIGLLILSGNIGFSLTILSYNKQLFFNFICEPRLMNDLEALVAQSETVFEELLQAARAQIAQMQQDNMQRKENPA